MPKILKNTTASSINIVDTGIPIPASPGTYTIPPQDYPLWAASVNVLSYINSGALVVNDGAHDLVPSVGITLLQDNIAFKIGFESDPERMNGFIAKNVQEAIEEAFTSDVGEHQSVVFLSNGATSNKWLQFFSSSDASNSLPMICYADVTINQWSFANITNNTDIDLEIYKNGSLLFTLPIRNKRWAYSNETNIPANSFLMGDRVSVFAKKVNGGTGVTPNSVLLRFNFQTTTNNHGTGGAQSGV